MLPNKLKTGLFGFLLPIFLIFFVTTWAPILSAQCPGCNINPACNVVGGGLCPDSLPGSTIGQPYNQDVTFYIPPSIDASPFSGGLLGIVPLVEMQINSISGLPFGLNWTCNMPGNGCKYFPSSNDTLGCVKICGVPVGNPGVYNLTIYVTATVNAGILGNQSAQTSFTSQMVLFPDTNSNSGFSMAPTIGCEPLQVSFQNQMPSNGYLPVPGISQGFLYNWNFGNGLQANVENPPNVLYNSAGNYPVTYQLTVDTFGFQLSNITLTSVACTDGFTAGAPDIYIRIFDGSGTLIHNTISSPNAGSMPQSYNLSIPAVNPPYYLEVWDDDSGLLGSPDDECYSGTENAHPQVVLNLPPVNTVGPYTQTFSAPNSSLTFNYTFTKSVFQTTVTDTVRVLSRPPKEHVIVSPSNFVCSPDSILLSVTPGFGYEWFMDDTVLVIGASSSNLWVHQTGKYKVRMYDLNTGCDIYSFDTLVTVGAGIPGTFSILENGGTLQPSSISGTFTYQWKFFNGSTFVDIPAPLGIQPTYTPPVSGQYALEITSPDGCKALATYQFTLGSEPYLPLDELDVYPNPVNGNNCFIRTGSIAWGKGWFRLTDLTGRSFQQESFELEQANSLLPVQTANLASGIYSLTVFIEGNQRVFKLIVP